MSDGVDLGDPRVVIYKHDNSGGPHTYVQA